MADGSSRPVIRLRGVRQNNLKNFDVDLPLHRLIVVTGLSGSGKSSLAFDTLFAEGQRRYIETFTPYARQFFDRMDKPQVDSIEGIPPAIAIEQRNAVRTTRSTVGTMTEICDYLKVLWPHLARLHCRQCGQLVQAESPRRVWDALRDDPRFRGQEVLVTFDLPLSAKLSLAESLALVERQGYRRWLHGDQVLRLEEAAGCLTGAEGGTLTVVQDRLRLDSTPRARCLEALEQAYHFGKGRLRVYSLALGRVMRDQARSFSHRLHCAACDLEYREPSPALFSYNHPLGACPACRGFGRIIQIDYARALPDRSLTLAQGVVKPWQTGMSAECQRDLLRFCRGVGMPVDVPFYELTPDDQRWVIEGDPDYGKDADHEWPRAWYGVKGYFRWLESKAYKMHVRVLLSRYRSYQPCTACGGKRLQPEALLYRATWPASGPPVDPTAGASETMLSLGDFYALPVREALRWVEAVGQRQQWRASEPLGVVLREVQSRLEYLVEVGLGYLTLDRPTRTLSGGETERVNLTSCLGARLVNTLYVLDEPSVGLHPRDTARLVQVLQRLRDAGNTVLVVEHEAAVIQAADHILDLGPGHGETGGHLVYQGPRRGLLKARASLTGQYLSGRRGMEPPRLRPVSRGAYEAGPSQGGPAELRPRGGADVSGPALVLAHATRHNLQDLTVVIPLGRLVGVTGVSGSGKTTLVKEVLLPLLEARLKERDGSLPQAPERERAFDDAEGGNETGGAVDAAEAAGVEAATLTGWEGIRQVVLVDQAPLGRTPRSNPAVYVGAFSSVRMLYARSALARQRGLLPGAFSFNSRGGGCERCRGLGFERIEMQFLSDVFIRCPDCHGRRYRAPMLEIVLEPSAARAGGKDRLRGWNIAEFLEATVDEAVDFLEAFSADEHAVIARRRLGRLQDVGLGYLRLGQPLNTLSGGECQRLKLAAYLADTELPAVADDTDAPHSPRAEAQGAVETLPALFLFDEPTTGLHFEDVRVLLRVFQRLVDAGHSVLVIEHNLDVIRSMDWVIDLGPEAGAEGGRVVVAGTPEDLAACPDSLTGKALARSATTAPPRGSPSVRRR